jgi:hypothetical protein
MKESWPFKDAEDCFMPRKSLRVRTVAGVCMRPPVVHRVDPLRSGLT